MGCFCSWPLSLSGKNAQGMLRRESDRVSVRFVQEYKNIYTQIARESCRRNETLERKKKTGREK